MLNTYSYDAYGRRECTPCTSGYNPFGYAGQYTDEESGLVYMRARYYDPATQQFISRDPSVALSGQPYVYAGASPLNASDPTGRFPFLLIGIIALGIRSGVAADVGSDFLFDNAYFDLGASLGRSLSDPFTYVGAIPVPGAGPITKSIRFATKHAGKGFIKSVFMGAFSIRDWRGYPTGHGVPRPNGPFVLLDNSSYTKARRVATNANRSIRRRNNLPTEHEVHEIHPVKFGGDPSDPWNKIILPDTIHDQYTGWWNSVESRFK
ncbi:MAG TPA: RHS repeat-associated core domain-containing protein [Chloroflexia bacterium]